MGSITGTLKVVTPQETLTFEWNGIPEPRAEARRQFEERIGSGQYMAAVVDAPGKHSQVRSFDEIEQIEKERGVVEARLTPALVGG